MREDDVWQGRKWAGRGDKMGPKRYGAATQQLFRRREQAGLPRVPEHLKPQWEQIVDELNEEMSGTRTNAELLAAAESEKKALEQGEKKALGQPDDGVDRRLLRGVDEAFPQALPEKWELPGFRDPKPQEQKWTPVVGEVTSLEYKRQQGDPKICKKIRWVQSKRKAVAAVNGVFGTGSLTTQRVVKGRIMLEEARRLQNTHEPLSPRTFDNL